MVNNAWLNTMSGYEAYFLEPGISDHCPGIVRSTGNGRKRKYPFKFFSFWMEHPSFKELLEEAWSTRISGNLMFEVYGKLKVLKNSLKQLNRSKLSDLAQKVSEARQNLETLQHKMLAS